MTLRLPNILQDSAPPRETEESTSSGRRKVRVFLDGREVPIINATAVYRANMPSMATIEMVPLGAIKFIKPRTQVHIFAMDRFSFGDDDFHLMFEGEVHGRSMIKRHDGRAFRITAYDYTNYWDDAKAYIMNPNHLADKIAPQTVIGEPPPAIQAKAAAGVLFQSPANSTSQMITLLTGRKGPDGQIDIVEGVAEVLRKMATVNEFFRASYERLRITDRMWVRSSGRLGTFLQRLKVEEFLTSFTGSEGGMVSLRQMLMGVMALMFHDQISIPFPAYLLKRRGKQTGYTITQFLFVPDGYPLAPPRCNVFFPNQISGFEFDESFRDAPTRYGFRASFPVVVGDSQLGVTYPIQYFPKSFARYMSKGAKLSDAEFYSLLGPSSLTTNAGGKTYANLFFGAPTLAKDGTKNAVQTAYSATLREADFLTNEESIKGIYYQSDILPPAYSALVRTGQITVTQNTSATGDVTGASAAEDATGVSVQSRNDFMAEVGAYLFYKKRYGARTASATVSFNPFVVPGFNALFLDDSEAGQSALAKVESVTHSLTHEGFFTMLELSHGRDFDEVDVVSGGAGEPPLPRWFDPSVFGSADELNFARETDYLLKSGAIDEAEAKLRKDKIRGATAFTSLSTFYQDCLGCDSITEVNAPAGSSDLPTRVVVTARGAVQDLIQRYKAVSSDPKARDAFVRDYIRRPTVNIRQSFAFLGAEPEKGSTDGAIPAEFAKFTAITDSKRTALPGRYDGTGYSDQTVLKIRRDVIDTYIELLRTQRGFRG